MFKAKLIRLLLPGIANPNLFFSAACCDCALLRGIFLGVLSVIRCALARESIFFGAIVASSFCFLSAAVRFATAAETSLLFLPTLSLLPGDFLAGLPLAFK